MKIYTDGSAYHKDGSAGYGVVYVMDDNHFCAEFDSLPPRTTVQQAELLAVIHALSNKNLQHPITILSDSDYVVNGMNIYAREWLSRALQQYGMTVFKNDTVAELYRILRMTLNRYNPDAELSLTKSDDTPIANTEEWENIWRLILRWNDAVEFIRVEGHSGDLWNDWADRLAAQGRELSYIQYELDHLDVIRDRRMR